MADAKDYRHIRCWGKMLGSYNYYIESEQRKAAAANAPLDAIYQNNDGTWAVASGIEREDTKQFMTRYMKELYGEQPST